MSKVADITGNDHFIKGEDKTIVFDIVDSAGTAQTMTGWALEWIVRKTVDAPSATLTKTTGAAQVAISNGDGTDDRATVTVTDTDTVDLPAGRYQHALRRTDAGSEQVLAYGYLELIETAAR